MPESAEATEALEARYHKVAGWLRSANYVTVLTGAGMSTESGLPDFRSSGGMWTQNRRFENLASIEAVRSDYDAFVSFYRWRIEGLAPHAPNEGHRLLARWQHRGLVRRVLTQNVDGFHQLAGSPRVTELHGSLRRIRCMDCGREVESRRFLQENGTACDDCSGRMRPAVVLFGEVIARATMEKAILDCQNSDLFLVLGSSLSVAPANSLPRLAVATGAKLVLVNQDPTSLDAWAAERFFLGIGEVLAQLAARLD